MRIVHIITRFILGGAQENTLISCQLLAQKGHQVTLITGPPLGPEGQLLDQTKDQPFTTVVIPQMRRQISPIRDLLSYKTLRRMLKEIRPDVVHTHSAKAGILGRLAAYRTSPRPLIVHTIHGLPFHLYQSPLLNRFYILLERQAAKWTDAFITVADAMADQSRQARIGLDKPYITAYSAIAQEGFYRELPKDTLMDFRNRYNIPSDAVVLITVARLFMLKGHDFIIASAKTLASRFPNAIWLFVGDGNLSVHYKKQVKAIGLADRFRFTGLLAPDQIPVAMQASDILVHCSLREGLARAIPQAMLCKRPVVAFDLDGTGELVDQSTGRLVKPGNIDQLVSACAELICNPALRARLGQAGWVKVHDRFRPEVMVRTVEQVYMTLLNQKTG